MGGPLLQLNRPILRCRLVENINYCSKLLTGIGRCMVLTFSKPLLINVYLHVLKFHCFDLALCLNYRDIIADICYNLKFPSALSLPKIPLPLLTPITGKLTGHRIQTHRFVEGGIRYTHNDLSLWMIYT